MSLLPQYKICPVCKRRYSWNPDVGKLFCPHCSKGKGNSLSPELPEKPSSRINKDGRA